MARRPAYVCMLMLVFSVTGGQTVGRAAQTHEVGRGAPPPRLPDNIEISRALEPVVARLLAYSETFRRQCEAIGAARHVRVRIDVAWQPWPASHGRARASIERHVHGALRARIVIPLMADYAELVPHELEHVLEQMDGWDLAARARAGDAGVSAIAAGTYETARATRAGLAAAREAYDGSDPVVRTATSGLARMARAISARATRAPDRPARASRR